MSEAGSGNRSGSAPAGSHSEDGGGDPEAGSPQNEVTADTDANRDSPPRGLSVAIAAITLAALLLRLSGLGTRVAHWEEAHLGWWVAESLAAGGPSPTLESGPLLFHLSRSSAGLLGLGDAAIRLPVALVGGLLPVSALAFRDRLSTAECTVLAGLLAVAPLVLYYTRFASGDALAACLIVAAASLATVWADRGGSAPLLGTAGVAGLAVAASPHALVPLGLLGALGAVAGVRPTAVRAESARTASGNDVPSATVGKPTDPPSETGAPERDETGYPPGLGPSQRAALLTAAAWLAFVSVVLIFYSLLADTDPILGLLAPVDHLLADLLGAPPRSRGIVAAVDGLVVTSIQAAPVLLALATVGVVGEWWDRSDPRPVVTGSAILALLTAIALPLLVRGDAPWLAMYVVFPLLLPGAVGLLVLARWTRAGFSTRDPATAAGGLLALLLATGLLVGTGGLGVYLSPGDADLGLADYGQPAPALGGPMAELTATAPGHEGTDIVYFGPHFVDREIAGAYEPACARWFNALPVPYYATMADATSECAYDEGALRTAVADEQPLLVVGLTDQVGPASGSFDAYRRVDTQLRAWNANTTILVRTSDDP